ncbi:MAG: G5 domain-containing protein [Clostridia bacterium]|nr:G5 domain-containing protein [Clostridia bacterium]
MITSYKKARHAAPSEGLSSFKKFTVVAVVGLAAAVSVMSAASEGKTAYISDSGITYTIAADSADVNTVLSDAGIRLSDGDETIVTEESGRKLNISIIRAFPVSIKADGETTVLNVTGGTVTEILKKAGVEMSANDFVTPAGDTELTESTEISVNRGVKLYLNKPNESELVYVPEGTVENALKAVGCELSSEGNTDVKKESKVESGMTLNVDEVFYRTTFITEKVEPEVIEEKSSDLAEGETEIKQEGKQGRVETAFKEKYVNGELVEKKEDKKTVLSKPVDTIVLVGTKKMPQKSASVNSDSDLQSDSDNVENAVSELVYVQAENKSESKKAETQTETNPDIIANADDTAVIEAPENDNTAAEGIPAYTSMISGSCTAYYEIDGITATGTIPKVGTVAVNPNVIPYGTHLYIASDDGSYVYGYAIAEDTGGACMAGDIIVDLYMNSEADCSDFGRRTLNIYILD